MPTPPENYRTIPLTQGKVALVDSSDYERLMQGKWFAAKRKTFYAQRNALVNGKQKTIYLHRVVLNLADDENLFVDHINRDTLDNRRCNLRLATHSQNQTNSMARSVSGYKGVYWQKEAGKWQATIFLNGRNKSLGYFTNPVDAHRAYCSAAAIY